MDNILDYFKFPIDYQTKTQLLSLHIQEDLELNKTKENEKSINQHFFQPTHEIGNYINTHLTNKYSYDIKYLKDTQKIIQKLKINK